MRECGNLKLLSLIFQRLLSQSRSGERKMLIKKIYHIWRKQDQNECILYRVLMYKKLNISHTHLSCIHQLNEATIKRWICMDNNIKQHSMKLDIVIWCVDLDKKMKCGLIKPNLAWIKFPGKRITYQKSINQSGL